MNEQSYLRSAVFVDFDNIFISLEREQPEAADLFGASPDKWLKWLEQEVPVGYREFTKRGVVRRILVRRCYINPRHFQRYRTFFIRAGFEVIDCPPLTAQGKTSADIHMVVDILDALSHETRFDEFIVLSADADFTPVLLRLRKHDRRTMVLAIGASSPAYKSAADYLLDGNLFLEKGLSVEELTSRAPVSSHKESLSSARKKVLTGIANRVREMANMVGGVQAIELPGVYKEFPEFVRGDDWLGFGSLRGLTEAIVSINESLELVDEDPWWVRERAGRVDIKDVQGGERAATDPKEISRIVAELVSSSDAPVALAAVAQRITSRLGGEVRLSSWLGAGSFKQLLERLDLGELEIASAIPGYVFDPSRHEAPAELESSVNTRDVAAPEIAERVSKVTDTPFLSTEHYAVIFRETEKEVNENGYHLTRTSKNVRDRCTGKGIPVSRSNVSFILKGIVFGGHRFHEGQGDGARKLGEVFVRNTVSLCSRAQMELESGEEEEIAKWILGGLPDIDDSGEDDGNGEDV